VARFEARRWPGLVGRHRDRRGQAPCASTLRRWSFAAAGRDLDLLDLGRVELVEHLAARAVWRLGRRRLAVPLDEEQVGPEGRGQDREDGCIAPAVHPRRLHQV
jgi:hypothetical protein